MKKAAYSAVNQRLGTILFILVVLVAAGMRLWSLGSLPPGTSLSEAHWALISLKLSQHFSFGQLLGGSNAGFAAYVGVGAIVMALRASILALRYMNAIWGIMAVAGLYFWVKDSFGRRAALLASFLMAVSPWAITLARSNLPLNLAIFALVWLCFFAQRAYKIGKWGYWIGVVITMTVGCFSTRLFWLVPIIFALVIIVLLVQKKLSQHKLPLMITSIVILAAVAIPLLLVIVIGKTNPAAGLVRSALNGATGTVVVAKVSLENAGKTVMMFFTAGDEDYTHNLGGVALLNTFVGLMFLLGIMLAVVRRSRMKFSFLLLGLGVLLLPSIIGVNIVAPDAYRAALALPFVFALAGVGANYLLTRWYEMFPINTTVRSLGLSFVLLLLLMTAYQGYRQYFVAWAQDPQTFVAYREDLVAAARYNNQDSTSNYIIADTDEQAVVAVVRASADTPGVGTIESLEQLPLATKPKLVIIPADSALSIQDLRRRVEAKYPGGSYGTEVSTFNERPFFVWYKLK